MSVDQATATPSTATVTVTAPAPIKAFSEGGDGPTFKDVIDILNPLQHIPVINTIYRHLTGDEEGAVADVGGGALWAGPVGLVGSLVDLTVKAESGKSIGDNILSWLGLGDDDEAPSEAAKTAQTQAQQQVQQQQAAAVTASLPAIAAQTLAPLPKRGDDRKDGKDKDGPAKVGDYMVFGATAAASPAGGTSGQPVSLLPVQSADATDPDASNGPSRQGGYMVFGGGAAQQQQTPAAVTVSAASTASAAPAGGQSTASHQGDYMVFGVPVPATAATRPVQVAQAAPVAAPAPVPVTVQTPAAAPAAATPAGLTPLPARTFAAPARRNQVTPNALPIPTTGPAAVPGHVTQTQAIPATMNQDNANWFAQAMSANLDKYAAAQKLADQSVATSAAGAQASADTFATIH